MKLGPRFGLVFVICSDDCRCRTIWTRVIDTGSGQDGRYHSAGSDAYDVYTCCDQDGGERRDEILRWEGEGSVVVRDKEPCDQEERQVSALTTPSTRGSFVDNGPTQSQLPSLFFHPASTVLGQRSEGSSATVQKTIPTMLPIPSTPTCAAVCQGRSFAGLQWFCELVSRCPSYQSNEVSFLSSPSFLRGRHGPRPLTSCPMVNYPGYLLGLWVSNLFTPRHSLLSDHRLQNRTTCLTSKCNSYHQTPVITTDQLHLVVPPIP